MPNVEILRATYNDETTFRNLYQFYMYEFAAFMGWSPNYGGRFDETDLDGCWTESYRHSFLITVEGKLGGLAIIDQPYRSYFDPNQDVAQMAEFFIMRSVQGNGVGEQVAVALFDQFPGAWEVFELNKNVNAQAFWRKVIGRYTNGQFTEQPFKDRGIVQRFSTPARP
ncbi:MAG: GNAT family N-acetyltransferase [Anaerolineae bacterium]|nr:GNAT family N-acetyltransferase [Anaerolineae bacterium]